MTSSVSNTIEQRARELFDQRLKSIHRTADRLFIGLLLFQYIAGIVAALWISPYTWAGSDRSTNFMVWIAIFLARPSFACQSCWRRFGLGSSRRV